MARPKKEVTKCSNPECQKPALAKGLCRNHYQQMRNRLNREGKISAARTIVAPRIGRPRSIAVEGTTVQVNFDDLVHRMALKVAQKSRLPLSQWVQDVVKARLIEEL